MVQRTTANARSGKRQLFLKTVAGIIVAAFTFSSVRGALWESPSWALTSKADAGVGYDTNLYARADGDGDGFAFVDPELLLFRRSSLTKFEIRAEALGVKFFERTSEDAIDPAIRLVYIFPESDETLSTQEMRASFVQSSAANTDVGRRLRQTDGELFWEGKIAATGKSAFEARARLLRTDYDDKSYNTNESAEAGLTYQFVSHDRLQLGAGYDLGLARSLAEQPGAEDTNSVSHALTFRGRGDFLPKVSGRFYIGLASIEYTGAQERSDQDVIAGALLAWKARERLELASEISRKTYFSPGAAATTRTSVAVQATQDLLGGFSVNGEVEVGQAEHVQDSSRRRDNALILRSRLRYAFTDRFSAAALCTWTTQTSNQALYEYDRTSISGQISCKF